MFLICFDFVLCFLAVSVKTKCILSQPQVVPKLFLLLALNKLLLLKNKVQDNYESSLSDQHPGKT